MKRRFFPLVCCAVGMLLLILDSRKAIASACEAMELCFRTVIPSLFPFFFLSACLTGIGGGNILFTGFLGGYPVGAQALVQRVKARQLCKGDANRMLTWCSQAGPSFIFGIAVSQFPGMRFGWYLWAIQIVSALSVRMLFSGADQKTGAQEQTAMGLSEAMQTALRAMGAVCGWVVIFRVILGFLERWLFFFLPDIAKILLSGFLELTNGCLMLHLVKNLEIRFLLCLLFLNFGGICVVLQTVSLAGELNIRYYLVGKLLQCAFALLFGCVFLGYFAALLPLGLFFLGILYINRRKNSSIPALVGV